MPFDAVCPFCPTRINRVVDEALGGSLRCPQCGNYFTLAPVDDFDVQQESRQFRHLRPCRRPATATALAGAQGGMAAGTLQLPRPALPVPASLSGPVFAGTPDSTGPNIWRWAAAIIAIAAAALCWQWPRGNSGVTQHFDEPDPHHILVVTPDNRQMIRDLGRSEWADAAKEALRHGPVHVRIGTVKLGAVKTAAGVNAAVPCLLIQVELAQLPPGKTFKGLFHGKETPTLHDDRGRQYSRIVPVDDKDSAASSDREQESDHLREVLAFDLPAAGVQWLRLEIPAAAWGRPGSCRFQISRHVMHISEVK